MSLSHRPIIFSTSPTMHIRTMTYRGNLICHYKSFIRRLLSAQQKLSSLSLLLQLFHIGKGSLPIISSPITRERAKKMSMETALRMIFIVLFLGWLMVWVLLPTKTYKQAWTPKLKTKLNSTYFGEQGCLYFSNLLLLLLLLLLL